MYCKILILKKYLLNDDSKYDLKYVTMILNILNYKIIIKYYNYYLFDI